MIGGWRTMVEAIDVRTCGLGGDSEVYFDREARLTVGPRKAMPLSLLAYQFPDVVSKLRGLRMPSIDLLLHPSSPFATPGAIRGRELDRLEQRVWDGLAETSRGRWARLRGQLRVLRRFDAWSIVASRRWRGLLPAMRCTCSGGSRVGTSKRRDSVLRFWRPKRAMPAPGRTGYAGGTVRAYISTCRAGGCARCD